jgi:hypothetical protein
MQPQGYRNIVLPVVHDVDNMHIPHIIRTKILYLFIYFYHIMYYSKSADFSAAVTFS